MCRGGAVPRGEVCKTGEAPARGAARSAAGGRRRRPKAGDAFRGGGTRPVPLTQNLRGEYGISPEKPPAERVLPAPRAGERTLSAFLHWLRPLRPAPGTVRSPAPARERFSVLPRYNHRAPRLRKLSFPTRAGAAQSFSTMQSPRVARNKRQSPSATQTSCFNLPASAFVGVSASVPIPRGNRSLPPRPSYPVGAGRGVFPVGGTEFPLRANLFRRLFSSSGKAAPAERKQTIFDCEESQVKLQSPCGAI